MSFGRKLSFMLIMLKKITIRLKTLTHVICLTRDLNERMFMCNIFS